MSQNSEHDHLPAKSLPNAIFNFIVFFTGTFEEFEAAFPRNFGFAFTSLFPARAFGDRDPRGESFTSFPTPRAVFDFVAQFEGPFTDFSSAFSSKFGVGFDEFCFGRAGVASSFDTFVTKSDGQRTKAIAPDSLYALIRGFDGDFATFDRFCFEQLGFSFRNAFAFASEPGTTGR